MKASLSPPETPTPQFRWWSARPRFFLFALLAIYAAFLWYRFEPAIVTPDANGYWAQGSLLATTGQTWFTTETDWQYVGSHWLITPDEKFYSRYPPGLAVIIAFVYHFFGFKASVAINPMMAWLTLLAVYLIVSRVISRWWAVPAVALTAVIPTFNRHALACDSHMAVTFFLAWGIYLLLRWSENGKLWEIFTAGLCLGTIPTIRYPEALFGIGISVFLIGHWKKHPRMGWHYLAAGIGAAIPIVPLLIRNHLAFGAFWRTAYSLTKEQTGFSWDYFDQHYVSFVRMLQGEGAGLVFALGLVGMTWMCSVRRWRTVGALLALLSVPIAFLYMAYYWAPAMGIATMRFMLPTFTCYVVGAVWLLANGLAQTTKLVRVVVAVVLVAVQGVWGGFTSWEDTMRLHYQKDVMARVTDALIQHTKPGDVVMTRAQFLQHLDFVRRWKLADLNLVWSGQLMRLAQQFSANLNDPDAPSPVQVEKQRRLLEKYGNRPFWEREQLMAREVQRWAGDRKIYFVGAEWELFRIRGPFFRPANVKIIARITLPEPPPPPRIEGLLGASRRPVQQSDESDPSTPPSTQSTRTGPRWRRDDQRPAPGGGQPGVPPMQQFIAGAWRFFQEKELVIAEWSYPD